MMEDGVGRRPKELFVRIVLGNWALIGAFTAVGLLVGYAVGYGEKATFTATARVILDAPDPQNATESTAIADTARAIVKSPSAVNAAVAGLGRDPDREIGGITVAPLGTSGLIDISVRDEDPDVAARIANNLAATLIKTRKAASALPQDLSDQIAQVDNQISGLDGRINDFDAQLQALNDKVGTADSQVALKTQIIADRLAILTSERTALIERRQALEGRHSLPARSALVVDAASAPDRADPSRLPGNVTLGGLLGLMMGLGGAAGRAALAGSRVPSPGAGRASSPLIDAAGPRARGRLRSGADTTVYGKETGVTPASRALASGAAQRAADRVPFTRVETALEGPASDHRSRSTDGRLQGRAADGKDPHL